MESLARLLLMLIIGLCAVSVSVAAPFLKQTDLFVSGQDGYHTYRIPAIVPAGGNVLLAFCEGRKNSGADAGDIDLLLRRSLDGGETWEKVQMVASNGNFTCGNPCPIVDSSDGTVWLLFCKNGAEHVEGLITEGKAPRTVWVTKSTDKGISWSQPIEITKDVKKPSWTWYATGPGHGIQLRSGRLLAACDHVNNGGKKRTGHSHAVYSDDHGKTWKIGGIVEPGTNESTAVELADGTVIINCRNARSDAEAPLGRVCAWSKDGGLTFEKPIVDQKLIEPICQASILRLAGCHDTILFSNPASGKREKMTIRMSKDGCKTWPVSRVLNEEHSAYSDLAECEDGNICCFYERGEKNPYKRLTFAKFNMEWLSGGKDAE